MAKYHISSSGKVVKCRAKGACPKTANFSSVKEAEASIEGTGTKVPKKSSQRGRRDERELCSGDESAGSRPFHREPVSRS